MVLSAGQVSVDTRLLLEAEQGSPDALRSVDLYLSAPAVPAASGDPWNWRAEQGGVEVHGAHRLPGVEAAAALAALGAADPLGEAALRIARPRGECWRVTFSRPLPVHEPVVLHAVLAPKAGEDRLAVPLTAVLGASRMEGEATLHLAAASPPQVEALGLREFSAAASAGPHGASAWRTFRYNGAAVALALVGRLQGGDRPAEAGVDWAALTTYVRGDGGLEHHYAFQASHWSQSTLPLQMPAGARLLAFQVDGVWSPLPPAVEDGPGGTGDRPAGAGAGRRPGRRRAAPLRGRLHDAEPAGRAVAPRRGAGPFAARPAGGLPPAVAAGAGIQSARRRPTATAAGAGRGHALRGPTSAARRPVPGGPRGAALPWPWPAGWDEARRPEVLPDVLLGLRGKEKKVKPIGVVLCDAAAALRRRHGQFLVVDAAALRDAGSIRPIGDASAGVRGRRGAALGRTGAGGGLRARRLSADDAAPARRLGRGRRRVGRPRGGRVGRRRGRALGPRRLRPLPGRGRRGRAPPRRRKAPCLLPKWTLPSGRSGSRPPAAGTRPSS